MPNYTKLFNSIVTSTIWMENDQTRIVWITMLAIADQHGEVHASIPGLARLSGVSIDATRKAIDTFLAPDPDSRTPDNEGRRISVIDGGWELLNHGKYRAMASKEDSKKATADRVRRHRKRNGHVTPCNGSVTACNATVTDERDIAEAEAEAEKKPIPAKLPKGRRESDFSEEFKTFWEHYPKKKAKKEAWEAWQKAKSRPSIEVMLSAVEDQSKSEEWKKNSGQFIPYPATWINQGRWDDEVSLFNQEPLSPAQSFSL